jgi:hypothetical protein
MHEFLKFLLRITVFSALLSIILFFLIPALPPKFQLNTWWIMICFFFLITSLFHFGLLRSIKKRPASITIYYMAGTTFKLLLYIAIMLIYGSLHKETAMVFVLTFFMLYFLYTIFEVALLYKKFSQPAASVNKSG